MLPIKNILHKNTAVSILYIIGVTSLLLMWLAPATAARLGIEDGPVENVSALLLLIASIAMVSRSIALLKRKAYASTIAGIGILIGVAFFVFAGEEISWGQRIFNIESGEFMQQYNWQGEVNLHNLHTDIFNIAFHFGALIFLIIMPLFRSNIEALLRKLRVPALMHFIPPLWIAAPSFIFIGMLDSRFIFIIEKPWAASLYLLALVIGVSILIQQLLHALKLKNTAQAYQFGFSLLLIGMGIFVSYIYGVDEQATNIISEYKELLVAAALCIFAVEWNVRHRNTVTNEPITPSLQ